MIDGDVIVFNEYDDIPKSFDYVISFRPNVPAPPHTQEEHDMLENVAYLFQELLSRARRHTHR